MTRGMLCYRENTGSYHTIRYRAPKPRNGHRVRRQSPIPDNGMGSRNCDVQHWCGGDGEASGIALGANQRPG